MCIKGEWELVECINELTPRHENSFVNIKDKFYLLGGRRLNPVESFDPISKKWIKLSYPPIEMHHFQAINYNDTIYVVGAMTGKYPREIPLNNIYKYNPATDTWTKDAEIPAKRQRGSCGTVVYKNKIYIIAGIIDGHNSGTVSWFDCYDPNTGEWTELSDAPNLRDHFHAIIAKDKLYLIGGRNTSIHEENNFGAFFAATIREVDCYDFTNNTWSTLDELLPIGTAAGGIATIGDNILYFGGESNQKTAHNQTQCFNINTGKWTLINELKRGRHGTQAINYYNDIYISSGSGNCGGTPELSSIEKFTVQKI